MKCPKCKVNIVSSANSCPLCDNNINNKDGQDIFPKIVYNYKHGNLLLKLLLVCSLIAVFISFFINYTISNKITWAWFVGGGIFSFWLTLNTALKTRRNFIKMLFLEMILFIVASLVWDYITGFRMWSVNFALPFLCSIYMISILIMRMFRKRLNKDFIFYATINSLIGLIPGVLIILNIVDVIWPSYISVILSITILVFLLIFNKRQVRNELVRRFHI